MKIGILGGTFNPIHNGHLLLGEVVREKMGLDKIIFLPTGNAPHKQNIAPSMDRYEMVDIAISDNENFEVLDIETKRDGFSFTIDSIKIIKSMYECTQLYFIIGLDTLYTLDSWYKIDEIALYTDFLVSPRMGIQEYDEDEIMEKINYLHNKYNTVIKYVETNIFDISSTEIRDRIASEKSIRYMVPKGVIDYIESKRLYR